MWTKELFGTEKPIIALLHLDPLPGDPDFCGSLDTVIEHASCDVKALQEGGVDGVLIANEFSFPMTYVSHSETLMAMACVIGAIKKDIHVPFGTNVVMNPEETIRMAKAVGASCAKRRNRRFLYLLISQPSRFHARLRAGLFRSKDRPRRSFL